MSSDHVASLVDQNQIIEQAYRTLKLDIPGSSKRKPCLPPPRVPRPPSMLEDESFGLQMDHVLVRFHAIAGQIGLDWLQSVADVRDDQLVHSTFKALIAGLDSTTTAPARQRRCAEILPAIRKRISSPDAVHMKNMVHLIFLLSYQELLVWNNAKAWMMHISGLSAVVQTLGPHAFTTPSDLRTFQQIRLFTVSGHTSSIGLLKSTPVANILEDSFELLPPSKLFPGDTKMADSALVPRCTEGLARLRPGHPHIHPRSTRSQRPSPARARHDETS